MGGDTLEKGQGIADPVGLVGGQGRRVYGRVDLYYFLESKTFNKAKYIWPLINVKYKQKLHHTILVIFLK